jgi:hypothetical protein
MQQSKLMKKAKILPKIANKQIKTYVKVGKSSSLVPCKHCGSKYPPKGVNSHERSCKRQKKP